MTETLEHKTVGICGAGGLGSNIAHSLVRTSVQHLIIVDYDQVEFSNLNRQFFFFDQVGLAKVEALGDNLHRINPHLDLQLHNIRVTEDNLAELFGQADILVEAFDDAGQKAMVANCWLKNFPDRYIVMGSGLAGYGQNELLHVTRHGKLVICGDQRREVQEKNGLCSARLGVVAQMQANEVIDLLMSG